MQAVATATQQDSSHTAPVEKSTKRGLVLPYAGTKHVISLAPTATKRKPRSQTAAPATSRPLFSARPLMDAHPLLADATPTARSLHPTDEHIASSHTPRRTRKPMYGVSATAAPLPTYHSLKDPMLSGYWSRFEQSTRQAVNTQTERDVKATARTQTRFHVGRDMKPTRRAAKTPLYLKQLPPRAVDLSRSARSLLPGLSSSGRLGTARDLTQAQFTVRSHAGVIGSMATFQDLTPATVRYHDPWQMTDRKTIKRYAVPPLSMRREDATVVFSPRLLDHRHATNQVQYIDRTVRQLGLRK